MSRLRHAPRIEHAGVPRVAVIGAGRFGRLHAQKYAELPCCRLSAVVDERPERAHALAAEWGVPAYTHHAQLAGRVDVVSVVTPAVTHHAVARDCLRCGLDVLVEKPIAATRGQARELMSLAQRHRRVLQVGHIERFNPAALSLLERDDAPSRLHCRRLAPFGPRGGDVDVLLDLMIHDLDLVLQLMRRDVVAIRACGRAVHSDRLDTVEAWLDFGAGRSAQLLASRAAERSERTLRLHYEDADVHADLVGCRVATAARPSATQLAGDPLRLQLASFLRCVRLRRAPAVGGRQGFEALDLALRIRDAATASHD